MNALLPWILITLVLASAFPWSIWFLAAGSQTVEAALAIPLTLALSTGVLSLVMFWQALAGIPLDLGRITLVYFVVMLPGVWLGWRRGFSWPRIQLPRTRLEYLALALLVMISAGVLFTSLYWPFSRADSIGIYAHYGEYMYSQRTLADLPGSLTIHEAYPILVPLLYTYAYLAAGWPQEFLARLFPAMMSIAILSIIYAFGRRLHSKAAGWIGALLLALTPTFGSWASSGYVDLPMAFFYLLAVVFAWRLWESGRWQDAALCGAMAGLAAWTKNAGLVGIGLLVIWLLWVRLKQQTSWPLIGLALAVCAGIAAPWYVRNWLGAGLIIPPTIWSDQASQTVGTLLVLATHPETYALSGPLILLSIFAALIDVIRRRLDTPALLLLLWWTLPFYAVWWWFASYDPRFVLLFLPVLCVLAGVQIARLWNHVPGQWQQRLVLPIAIVMLILGLRATWD
ncbi:MAG: glycosyltransferase family 39 protein, partial [Anaerolineae bacterium]|nr:glycosyltransferase family 39 protein [Anaerolineae bacterium]